ncbi:MAG: ATP-binding cassette domain-containing protein [Deltaproteobacteria bacterium]|jgi:ABC-2 type transport system ATP-binding protein|nr:ATP-binding cassette domain-containing protein [Deltaproteobacteria bacterium]
MTDVAIEVAGLKKTFKGQQNPALDGISTTINHGSMTGVVGPDGAGKTTFMRLLVGLLAPESGAVSIDGMDPIKDGELIRAVSGYMPQKFGLYEDLSVLENLKLYSDIRGLDAKRREEKLEALLKFTSLAPFTGRLAGRLSGGMKQKLGLACVLLGDPKFLFLDEPSVGVDPISRQELWRMVRTLSSDGITIVWGTSYLDEAEKCDRVILLCQGQKLYEGLPQQAFADLQGRCFKLSGIEEKERRPTVLSLLQHDSVTDCAIVGSDVRIVKKPDGPLPALNLKDPNAHWTATQPSFEDAFIELLGGGPHGQSPLADSEKIAEPTLEVVVEAKNLTKNFGDFIAVKDNSFQIYKGEIFGLIGPNGAGKSTTFKMMCGLIRPSSGLALIAGIDLRSSPSKARSRIGYMAQKFSLYNQLSVAQNLHFFSGVYGLCGKHRKNTVDKMVEIFDLAPYLNQNADSLSLGFKQRLALACAVMHEPDVLFLDEPTSGVDPVTRREFWLHLNYLATQGVTIMVTTHFMEEAEYCDRIALIHRGLNIACGTPENLKSLVRSDSLPSPTMEDAFIWLIKQMSEQGE